MNRQLSLVVSVKEMEEVRPILTFCGFGRALGCTELKYLGVFAELWGFFSFSSGGRGSA